MDARERAYGGKLEPKPGAPPTGSPPRIARHRRAEKRVFCRGGPLPGTNGRQCVALLPRKWRYSGTGLFAFASRRVIVFPFQRTALILNRELGLRPRRL